MTRRCATCHAEFTVRSPQHKFCSTRCKDEMGLGADNSASTPTFEDVAAELGLSKSRIDQIEKQALRKLRALMRREDWL